MRRVLSSRSMRAAAFKCAFRGAAASVLAVAAVLSSVGATSGKAEAGRIASNAVNLQTYAKLDDIAKSRLASNQYTGVGFVYTETTSTPTTNLVATCSGSLVGGSYVLLAAHCLDEDDDFVTRSLFILPDAQGVYVDPTLPRDVYQADSYLIHPDWQGTSGIYGSDVALLHLSRTPDASLYKSYDLYTGEPGSEIGQIGTRIGLGLLGTGAEGNNIDTDFAKHIGYNSYDAYWDQLLEADGAPNNGEFDYFGAPVGSMLAYDFDDGTPLHDAIGRIGINSLIYGLGVYDADGNLLDSSSARGDSGGPTFINGKIAGITSFGITGAAFTAGGPDCGEPGSVDPSFDSSGFCTNSSFGEISVDTRVASYQKFINGAISGQLAFNALPEPATWAQMILGFGLVGGWSRRRRTTSSMA